MVDGMCSGSCPLLFGITRKLLEILPDSHSSYMFTISLYFCCPDTDNIYSMYVCPLFLPLVNKMLSDFLRQHLTTPSQCSLCSSVREPDNTINDVSSTISWKLLDTVCICPCTGISCLIMTSLSLVNVLTQCVVLVNGLSHAFTLVPIGQLR